MSKVRFSRRDFVGSMCTASFAVATGSVSALCAAPPELGRWRNLAAKGDPAVLDLRMDACGDQVLNGVQTETRYSMRAWVLQSSGQFYGRPSVRAFVRQWKGHEWVVGRVPTGGYVDNIWARTDQRDGRRVLRVLILHESLDRKPSATTEHWFGFEKRL